MSALELEIEIQEGGHHALLTMRDPLSFYRAEMLMDAGGLDDMISKLAQVRAMMADKVPPTIDPPAKVLSLRNPAWYCAPDSTGPLVCFRHPGLGWLGFQMPFGEAKALAGWLTK